MEKVNEFGYREELNRSMGSFSSFAVSFSLISVLTGIFANFSFGYQQAGGAIIYTWLFVSAGQFVVALVMANLSIRFPIAGYGYQWAARLVHSDLGFFVGWLLLIQFITGFPGICQTFTITLMGLAGIEASIYWITIGTIIVISVVALIHLLGIRVASTVNNVGVFAELIGVALLIILLFAFWIFVDGKSTSSLSLATRQLTQMSLPFSSLALSMLLGAWCLTGFEAAADLTEEVRSPSTSVPRAVVVSQATSAVFGFLIILLFVLQAANLSGSERSGNILLNILEHTFGPRLTFLVILIILLSIFACAVAALATVSRLLFSLSRDNILPFSSWLSKVEPAAQTPRNAILLIWALSIFVIVFFKKIEVVTNVSALASYLGYAGIMLACLLVKHPTAKRTYIYTPRWERLIHWIAFVWTLVVVAALSIPETRIEGYASRHLPALSTVVAFGFGLLLYIFHVRKKIRTGIAGPPVIHKN